MVSLRDGKTYDPSNAEGVVSSGTSTRRRQSTANNPTPQRTTRRLASTTAGEDNVPFHSQDEPVTPLTRGKRQRPQQLTEIPEPPSAIAGAAAAGEDADDLYAPDIDNTDQNLQLQAAAAMALPADEPSPTPSAKKPRIPAATRTPTPSKTAAAAAKERHETVSVSIAAAVMVLVAAVAMAVLLPGLAPHRDQLKTYALETAAHTNDAYLQPLKAQAIDGLMSARAQIAAASAAAQQQAQSALLQAQQRWPHLVPAALQGRGDSGASVTAATWRVDNLDHILPDGQQWTALAADMADKLQAPPAQRNLKAPALLLACGSDDDCNEAAAALAVMPPKGEACSLTINSVDLQAAESDNDSQPAAALQAVLAPFLQRCPAGLVVLRGAEALPVAAIPALHNALSEQGGFQHNGKVDAFRAAYALLLQVQPAQAAAAAAAPDSASADAGIKDAFFSMLLGQIPAEKDAHWEGVERAVRTLHRRIDFAAPVRLGTSTEAALDAEAQQAHVVEAQEASEWQPAGEEAAAAA